MNWFKVHHGMAFDPKFAVVARRANVPRGLVVAVWCTLLDHASQNDPRGSIGDFDAETVAVSLDMEQEQVEAIVSAMRDRDMIEGETLCNWEKRQTGTSTERVRRYRERRNVSGNANETVAKPSEPLRNSTETIDKSREEQNREDNSDPNGSVVPAKRGDPADLDHFMIPDFCKRATPEPISKAFDNYNIAATEFGLPKAEKLTEDRKRKLRQRLKEHGLEGWNRALETIGDSPFLRGDNERGWRADLDFLLQPKSFNRLIEGAYKPDEVA